MKTTITVDGTLTIKPETELEAYALSQWCKTSFAEPTNEAPSQFIGKLHVSGELDKTPAVTLYSGHADHAEAVLRRLGDIVDPLLKYNRQPYSGTMIMDAIKSAGYQVLAEHIQPIDSRGWSSKVPDDAVKRLSEIVGVKLHNMRQPSLAHQEARLIICNSMREVVAEFAGMTVRHS